MKIQMHQNGTIFLFSFLLIMILAFPSCKTQSEPQLITPGAVWKDNNGIHINAHGGGMLYHKGTYFWYGEHKIEGEEGNKAKVGVHVYSSVDLYNWEDKGIAL